MPGFIHYDPSIGDNGYECAKIRDDRWPFSWGPWSKSLWEIEIKHAPKTLMYRNSAGLFVRIPPGKWQSDFGSIPPPLRVLPNLGESRFLLSYLFHDWVYADPYHLLMVSDSVEGPWGHMVFDREMADAQLHEMILHEPQPGRNVSASAIYAAVRMFGGKCWGAQPKGAK